MLHKFHGHTIATFVLAAVPSGGCVLDEEADHHPDPRVGESADGGVTRPDDADVIAAEDFVVATVEVPSTYAGTYTYTFISSPDGTSGVGIVGPFSLPPPLDADDVCPLHTFLKVAESDAVVPSGLVRSCSDRAAQFVKADVDLSREDLTVADLKSERTGEMAYELVARASYCSGGSQETNFINERCSDIEDRVEDTESTFGVGWGECAIMTDFDGSLLKDSFCHSHVTGGWLQITGSVTALPNDAWFGTTKTRWQVAGCVQPLEVKWKARNSSGDSWPGAWTHFADLNPDNWLTMTLYAGTASTGYLCTGGNCWQADDYRVAVEQEPGDGRFRAAHGWALMNGKSTSAECTLAL